MYPYPPWIWTALFVTKEDISLAYSFAIAASFLKGMPRSLSQAARLTRVRAASMRIAMSAIMNWIAWCSAIGFENWMRSFAYLTDSSKAPWEMPTAIEPIPIRPPSRILRALTKPWFSPPSNASFGTRQSVRRTCDVALPRTPSLSSIFPIERPGFPRSTMNALMPRFPAPGSVIAWMTNVPATGAFVQNVFVPSRTQPSFVRFAIVRIAAASEPLVGSVRAQAPIFRPLARSGIYFFFCASFPASQIVPVQRELWAAMIRACEPHTRAISSTPIARARESRPAPSNSVGMATPRKPSPAIFATVAFGNSPVLSTRAATGRISFSAKSWAVWRIISCSGVSSKSIDLSGVDSTEAALRTSPRSARSDLSRLFRFREAPTLIPDRAEDLTTFDQQVDHCVPLLRHVVDDVRVPAFAVHFGDPRTALLVRERVQARTRERPSIQHDEEGSQVDVRLREPEVLQLRDVPVDELPLGRPLDQEREVEPEPVPNGHEVPGRLQDAFVEGDLDHLLLSPFPFRRHLERTARGEVVREALILHRHDAVLLGIVPGRLEVEVVEGQEEPFRGNHRRRRP